MEILNIEQLAKVLHKSPKSIRSDRVRNPTALPPSFTLPNSRRILFRRLDVDDFLNNLALANNLKRGRPRKQPK